MAIAGAIDGKAPAELYDVGHPDPRTRVCTYRGLGAFREEDAGFYFGREPDRERLAAAVVDGHSVVAVVGASGSGKSSLVRAGLIPQLRRERGERIWQAADMMPGANPFLALARGLLPLREPKRVLDWAKGDFDDECDRLQARLERDGAEHLAYVVGQILEEEPGTTHLLLLIDQWEELYTNRPSEAAAAETYRERVRLFIRMLLDAVDAAPLRVALTLRADYWGEVLNDEPLAARLLDGALVHLRALDWTALEAVIRRPAEKTGLMVSDALLEALLNAAEGQPGDLPLLEFTLQQLWAKRAGDGALTLEAYRAMGGLEKAIVTRAEGVHTDLTPEERDAVPGVFAALVQVGDARTDLRRRACLRELGRAGQAVARRLADERLLVTSRDWVSGEELVEVAHEALLRHWPKLDEWILARRGALLTLRQLQSDTLIWLAARKSPSYLWSHERVREAAAALGQLGTEVVLSAEEEAFLGPLDSAAMRTELERPETTHERRKLIGERLDVLEDPRPGIGVAADGVPSIEWRRVQGGETGIEVERRLLGGTKTLRKQVDDVEIARYPVTVSQYRAFLDAEDGWRDSRWWAEDLYRDPEGDNYDIGRFGNHPAVYVCWFDAMAFCRWLGSRLRRSIRLPDEWEWQYAATGGDPAKAFPRGRDWDPNREPYRANTFESRLGAATAVGMYPAGASPGKAMDMVGTVWEWCLNKYNSPQITASGNCDFFDRVLRGGSWSYGRDVARSAFRDRIDPCYRSNYVGFRVICSSPID